MLRKLICLLLQALLIGHAMLATGQPADTAKKTPIHDSLKTDFVSRMQAFAQKSSKESAADFAADKATIAQNKVFEEIKKTLQLARIYLKSGVDTSSASRQQTDIERDLAIASDGVLIKKGTAQTFRNLTATSKILIELTSKIQSIKTKLDLHRQKLTSFRYQLDSLISVPDLFKFPKDSANLAKYLQQVVVVAHQVNPVDSALKAANEHVQTLLNKVNMTDLKLEAGMQEVDEDQVNMATNTLKRDFEDIWGPVGYFRPLSEILSQAKAKGELTLLFYVQDNSGKVVILILLIITCFIYLRSLKNIYIEKGLLDKNFDGQLVLKYPLLSALIIIINLFQFLFFSPPFALNMILWAITCVSLSCLFRTFITKYWMRVWLIMVFLFLLSAGDNLILQASRAERWLILFLSLTGTIIGTIVSIRGRKQELKERWIVLAIGFMAILEGLAVVSNIFGRYNLAKTLLIGGYLNVVIAILFLWTVRLINEGLFLAFNVYVQQDKKLFYLNFDKVGKKVPAYFYVLLVIGWLILIGRNFAWFTHIAVPLREFFSRDRTIGDYAFSINKLLLFFAIMIISVIVSRIVSFFASDNHLDGNKGERNVKQGVGSWLLLIRITILSSGLFLAIAAAGIPVDRIAIILGALGVGIGFGLQTIVNNLVSGLIIAFEKPVNVGDLVEVDGQSGTMKSIGFRSSVISNPDGADIVMPNGDLLNAHLTNWTLGGNRKRVSILIGVAYNTDLQNVKTILTAILETEDRVANNPAPVVQYEQFGNSAIDVRVFFWARHVKEANAIKSDLIMAINSAFVKNNIVIPYPQQDVYVHNPANNQSTPL